VSENRLLRRTFCRENYEITRKYKKNVNEIMRQGIFIHIYFALLNSWVIGS
jgi:hypothetical protein